jgi:tryptophan 2,3-dioxygenase
VEPETPAPGTGRSGGRPLSYATYLKIPELLSLQKPLSSPPEHDEMLFIIIHQVYELWFRLMIHEVGAVREAALDGKVRKAARLYRRLIEIQRVLLQQIAVLETMTPADFVRFRDHLNPASGFQSRQFRELESLSGMGDPTSLPLLGLPPDETRELRRRTEALNLREAFDALLRLSGFDVPSGAAAEATAAARTAALLRIYSAPEEHYDLYNLCEAMIEYDENFQLWRYHHVTMVERMIGHKRGTGGTDGVSYLLTTLRKRSFPELWEVRTRIGGDGGYGGGTGGGGAP